MPDFAVNSDETAQTSSQLLSNFSDLQTQLSAVRNSVNGLLAQGYRTPAAQQKFQPFFDEFTKGFDQVNQALQGIAQYVKQVGDAFDQTDQQLGSAL